MEIDLSIDVKGAAASLKNYQRRRLPNVVRMTLNKTIRGVLTDTKKVMARRIGMTQREIAARTDLIFAAPGKLSATLKIHGERRVPNLSNFKAKQLKRGVSAKVWEKRKVYKGTFLVKNGKGTVFKRVSGAEKVKPSKGAYAGRRIKRGPRKGQAILRQPIAPVFGTSLRREFVKPSRQAKAPIDIVSALAYPRFEKEFDRQIKRIQL